MRKFPYFVWIVLQCFPKVNPIVTFLSMHVMGKSKRVCTREGTPLKNILSVMYEVTERWIISCVCILEIMQGSFFFPYFWKLANLEKKFKSLYYLKHNIVIRSRTPMFDYICFWGNILSALILYESNYPEIEDFIWSYNFKK